MFERLWEIDFFRGIAISMMVWFHFLWDLNYFEIINVSLYSGFWGLFQKATAGLFLFLIGVSLTLSYNRKKHGFSMRFLLRGARIFAWGLAITLFSVLFIPSDIIFFGILHLIGVSIILSIPFISGKRLPLLLGLFVVLLPLFFDYQSISLDFLVWAGFSSSPPSLDFAPVFPWFGAVLLGISAGNFLYSGGTPKFKLKNPGNKVVSFAGFLGKHSLFIYFIHQMVLFPLVFLFYKFF
ncbi:MAG: hypothetical protein QT03_C0001G1119 [archaeon GW2011_AR10]|nr:MAG: hypothetical protein QT03_C0001G1119 [archaeon GW2011_AR10]